MWFSHVENGDHTEEERGGHIVRIPGFRPIVASQYYITVELRKVSLSPGKELLLSHRERELPN